MKNRLLTLYKLQQIDKQLDELKARSGDLPVVVEDLEERIKGVQETIEQKMAEKSTAATKREENLAKIIKLQESQKKYKAQLYQVRNNREYDALTKEIDFTEAEMSRLEKENEALLGANSKYDLEINDLTPFLKELTGDLDVKKGELKSILSINEKEFKRLSDNRDEIIKDLQPKEIQHYEKVRKARGKAVVTIQRGACGGCFSVVPSQRQLEIKRNDRIYTCEYCGRILVARELAIEAGDVVEG
ncbi:MAG: hypothetical protein IAE91_08005 [Ignavibacteriaceae bacterium]|nr:hypothetical protein [Ignavibacteriaceae bacterium]